MCHETEKVLVKIPNDLSSTGRNKWKLAQIDKCIAPIVKALQEGGIDMRGSCCGHNKVDGTIHLQDGRMLVIKKDGDKYYRDNPGTKNTIENG